MKKYIINCKKISKEEQNNIKSNILKIKHFSYLEDNILENLEKKINIDKKIILSYRNQYLKNYVIINHKKIANQKTKIIKDYSKLDILKLSKKYKYPPMGILRLILKDKYPNVKLSLKNLNEYDNRDKKQILLAEENDIISNLDQKEQQDKSEKYEEKIAHFLDKKNIEYETQEKLISQQKEEKGYSYATPDFLLKNKIIINNKEIKWLEVKNFYGSDIKFIKKKIQKQIDKYYKIWGFGCVVFRYAFYENLKLNNCLIICF